MEKPERIDINEVMLKQHTDLAQGLSTPEAQNRLSQYGLNEIKENEESILQRIWRRLWGPIPWMIEVASILSAIAQKWENFTIITILLFVNVIVDYSQESKALNVLKVLKEKLAKKALVKRDGTYIEIAANQVVPGDIVKLKIGDIVPADAAAANGSYVQVDQAALTGESLPVNKTVGDVIYGNSIIKMGEMEAVVTQTGMNTFFGKSASLVVRAGSSQRSHFQKAVLKIGNGLIILTIFLAILLIIVALFRHDPPLEVLRFILVLVVASIPVALPAVLSVTMAIGAMNLARRQAIVSRLPAIEEIAGVDVLCSDKTGTLTQNKMSIATPALYNQYTSDDLFLYAALASRKENNDPIEIPIFEKLKDCQSAQKFPLFKLQSFVPFDPVRKRTEASLVYNQSNWNIVKGAPQVILHLCQNEKLKSDISHDVHEFATKGYRTLGVAVKKDHDKLPR